MMNAPEKPKKYFAFLVLISLVSVLLIRFFRLSVYACSDFEVYWYAVQAWVTGKSPYIQYSQVYEDLVYKYPPWTLALFLPFAKLDLQTSKWIWTLIECVGI